jgi:hypothetical protein
MDDETGYEKYVIPVVLLAMFVGGSYGVSLFEHGGKLEQKYLEHVSMAFAVSGLIGLSIEVFLRRQLIRNVFRVAIGYLLRDEIKEELRWIYGLKWLCISHVHNVTISRIANEPDLVVLHTTITRHIKNISDLDDDANVGLFVDEWHHNKEHRSKIISVTYQAPDRPMSKNIAIGNTERTPHGIRVKKTSDVCVPSGKTMVVTLEYDEVRRVSDTSFILFSAATNNPSVVVDAPDDLDVDVIFDHREKRDENSMIKKGSRTWQLPGLLLPFQNIRIRWHDKALQKEWVEQG